MSPLRQQFLQDMILAGFKSSTQEVYLRAVLHLIAFYEGVSPEKLSESQVEHYTRFLLFEKKMPRGTFQTHFCGLKFFFENTLNRNWALFLKKKFSLRYKNVFRNHGRMPIAAL